MGTPHFYFDWWASVKEEDEVEEGEAAEGGDGEKKTKNNWEWIFFKTEPQKQ